MIVIEDNNGVVYCINPGETHMTFNGLLITYDQVLEWIVNGTLREHGFRAPTMKNERKYTNSAAVSNSTNQSLLAAII
jgi:hypothetical protein